ncbi:MAG: hypothetical protein PVJ75_16165 [Chloroflexota bacterium]|jgi:hypothetical protein
MPARRERLYICPNENGQPAWIVGFPSWWERRAFFEQYGQRQIDTGNPFYVDYGLLLTGGEARAWHKRRKEALAGELSRWPAHVTEAMERLESMLKTAGWVIVESYEWESGLD